MKTNPTHQYYKQNETVSWLKSTVVGTIWVSTFDNYIQPEDETLRTTEFGLNLSLLDDDSLSLFTPIHTYEIPSNNQRHPLTILH